MCAAGLRAETTIFDRYADTDGVTTVYISKAMLSMMPNLKTEGMQVSEFASKLDYIRILTCEKKSLIPKIKKDAARLVSEGYEMLMQVNDEGEKVDVYMKSLTGNKNEYLLCVTEPSEITLIVISGNITTEDIQKMVKTS